MSELICPEQDVLRDFALGKLGGAPWESMAEHVEGCPNCQDRLAGLDRSSDDLLTQLGQLKADGASHGQRRSFPGHAVIAQATRSGRGALSIAADAGRDLARRLREGPVCLDRFELRSELGVGSFGYVFQAWDPQLERIVALKVQRAGSFASHEEVQRFLREARTAAQLKHPAIVAPYETGQTQDDVCFLVCEYVDGITLEERLKGGALAPAPPPPWRSTWPTPCNTLTNTASCIATSSPRTSSSTGSSTYTSWISASPNGTAAISR